MIKNIYPKIFLLLVTPVFMLSAGSNLPQVPASSVIKGKEHRQIKSFFGNYDYLPGDLDDSVGKILLRQLPKEYKEGCRKMVNTWGKAAKNSSATAVKPVHLVRHPNNTWHILLVYTCYSAAEGFGDRYYDERLALLKIDSTGSTISVIPHGSPCDKCSELSHIRLYEDTLRIDNKDAVSVIFGTSNDNPCCVDSVLVEEVSLKYFTIDQDIMKEQLTLNVSRQETYRDGTKGDSTAQVMRVIETLKDKAGNIVTFMLHTEFKVNGAAVKRGIGKYSWNRKSKTFEEEMR